MATDGDNSFIQEVNEELRRDRMYRVWRRYGPALILALTLFVAWFAWTEWSRVRDLRAAEARGAAFSEAMALPEGQRVAALEALTTQGGGAAPIVLMRAGGVLLDEGDASGAAASFSRAASASALPEGWRELARLRALMAEADALAPADLLAALEPLTADGRPWRHFAQELKAMVQIRAEDSAGAAATLEALAASGDLPTGMAARVADLRRALGVSAPAP